MRGADTIVREILRNAVARVYDKYFNETNTQQIEQYFHLGGTLQVDDSDSSKTILGHLKEIQGLVEKLGPLHIKGNEYPAQIVAAAEFLLEGLYAHKKLSRSEERGFTCSLTNPRAANNGRLRARDQEYEDWQQRRSGRRGSFN